METRGHNRTPWWLPSNGNVQNCSHFSTYRRIPCFAVPDWGGYNRVPRPATLAEPSGGRYGRTSSWHAAIPETARRPPGFVEGNRGLPQARRDHGPALGEAGGNARSPPPA